jgi:hypothetical protein
MRYLVTPAFSEKVTSIGGETLAAARKAMARVEGASKEQILSAAQPVTDMDPAIYTLPNGNSPIFLTFGSDHEGDYALILDITVHGAAKAFQPVPSEDPRKNPIIDPFRNMLIDPTRNMLIDPNRNMLVDPFRNMLIDPSRNMMIDPARNMMIDLRRNMTIDPARNFSLDPKRNWLINPNRNSAWAGPYLYDLKRDVAGFVIRANEKVALLFNPDGSLASSVIQAGEKNFNLFSRDGNWTGFFVHNGAQGFNRFDGQKRWDAFLVGELHPEG